MACSIEIKPQVLGVDVTDFDASAPFVTDAIDIELNYSWNHSTCATGFDATGFVSVEVPCSASGDWLPYDEAARSVEFFDDIVFKDTHLPFDQIRFKYIPFGNTTGTVTMLLTLKKNV
jgi:hypothetical protein